MPAKMQSVRTTRLAIACATGRLRPAQSQPDTEMPMSTSRNIEMTIRTMFIGWCGSGLPEARQESFGENPPLVGENLIELFLIPEQPVQLALIGCDPFLVGENLPLIGEGSAAD